MNVPVVTVNCRVDDRVSSADIFHALREGTCMLLESREVESGAARYTRMMIQPSVVVRCDGARVTLKALSDVGRDICRRLAEDNVLCSAPFSVSSDSEGLSVQCPPPPQGLTEMERLKAPSQVDVLRRLLTHVGNAGCLYGGFAYDFIETFEDLPAVESRGYDFPDFQFFLAEEEVIIDHVECQAHVTVMGDDATRRCDDIVARLKAVKRQADDGPVDSAVSLDDVQCLVSDDEFAAHVKDLQRYIHSGDIYQVVPSRGFLIPCSDAFQAYQCLRRSNPSPYLFYYRDSEREIFGSSPESAVKVEGGTVTIRPIAGTMPRALDDSGHINADEDIRQQVRLRTDGKETAEHIMLVDLARNDVARISKVGTRHVSKLLSVELYSRVMHLVSEVRGTLRDDLDALDAYRATMNMGTLTGAPKIRATELIRQVEGARRGIYGGGIGYICARGDLDTCIAIRCAQVENGRAIVRAGAGVVRDSHPDKEAAETFHKARAVLEAIACSKGQMS